MANKLRVIGSGGGSANLTTLAVTPTKAAQVLTPTAPVDGYNRVEVAAVTAAIDANIVAGNIKNGVEILGVTGNYEGEGGGGDAPELVGYLDAQMIEATTLLELLDINQDGHVTVADYNAIALGDPADIVNFALATTLAEAYIENPTTSLTVKKYAQDFVSGGFAGLAIPILADGDSYYWVVIDFGYIIDHNGDMQFANYAVYKGAVPYNVPYAFGVL